MTPRNVIVFPFAGYGPELSRGLAAVTSDGRLVLAEAAGNPGTSITNAIEAAADAALAMLNLDYEATEVLQWTPDDPVVPNSVWPCHSRKASLSGRKSRLRRTTPLPKRSPRCEAPLAVDR